MKNSYLYPLLLATTAFLASCGLSSDTNKRRVMVSIEPLRYFTEQIAGDRFEVHSMVPTGGNPEVYEPNAKQMVDLSKSDLYIKVGQIGFERTWMKKLEKNAPHTIIIDSSEGIRPEKTHYGHDDPHTWMSTVNAIVIAQNIYRALADIDNKDSLYFKSNLENLVGKIRLLDTHIREQMTRDKSTTFIVYHPSLTYFARDYALTQLPIEEEGREPSVAQLKTVIALAKERKARCLFVQREFDNRNISIVAKETGAEIIQIDPLSYHWDEEMMMMGKRMR